MKMYTVSEGRFRGRKCCPSSHTTPWVPLNPQVSANFALSRKLRVIGIRSHSIFSTLGICNSLVLHAARSARPRRQDRESITDMRKIGHLKLPPTGAADSGCGDG